MPILSMVLTFIITKLHGRKAHYPIIQGRQKQISCGKATNFAKVHLEKNESYGKNKESENDREVGQVVEVNTSQRNSLLQWNNLNLCLSLSTIEAYEYAV